MQFVHSSNATKQKEKTIFQTSNAETVCIVDEQTFADEYFVCKGIIKKTVKTQINFINSGELSCERVRVCLKTANGKYIVHYFHFSVNIIVVKTEWNL